MAKTREDHMQPIILKHRFQGVALQPVITALNINPWDDLEDWRSKRSMKKKKKGGNILGISEMVLYVSNLLKFQPSNQIPSHPQW